MTTSMFNSIRDDPIRTASSFFVCNNRLLPASNQTPWGPGNRIGAIISPGLRGSRVNLIDVNQSLKANPFLPALLGIAMLATVPGAKLSGLNAPAPADPPPSGGGFFPLSEVHRGQIGTAWTVFSGTRPEPMQVEILGVLRGARGPGHDMILAQLHGAKPEYTGVVAGMSGSPVYIGDKLLGSLSYRIGQFSKDPIAGITPIEQMLEVRDRPAPTMRASVAAANPNGSIAAAGMNFQAMETPLVMSGFSPEAVQLWEKKMAGTGLEMVAAGGGSGSSKLDPDGSIGAISPVAIASIVPGSSVSAQLIRGDLEISATCTVTYVDPKQLLACGHPILQAGPVSLPMTTAEVVDTLASPLNAFKIINTGDAIGAFTEDRDSAILGVLGSKPHMIPVHITVHGEGHDRKLNIEVLDLPSLTPQAVLVALYETLLESNQASAETSYHVRGNINIDGYPPSPLDLWAPAGDQGSAQLSAALQTDESFARALCQRSASGRGACRRPGGRCDSASRAGGTRVRTAEHGQHCPRWRHHCGGSDGASVAADGTEHSYPDHAAGTVRGGHSASAGFRCSHIGPRADSAAHDRCARSIWTLHWPRLAASIRQTESSSAFWYPRHRLRSVARRSPACLFPWPMRWNRCARRRMQASMESPL